MGEIIGEKLEEINKTHFVKLPKYNEHSSEVLDETLVEIVPNATGPPGYKCKECDVFHPRKWHMKLHIRKHTGEKPYICDFQKCDKAFPRPGSLSEHKRRIHEKLFQHVCPICDKKFYDRSDMVTHIVIHDEARQSRERFLPPQMMKLLNEVEELNFDGQLIVSNCVCDKCSKIFNKKSMKERHVRSVHSRQHKCLVGSCGNSFFADSGLASHTKKCQQVKSAEIKPETIKQEKDQIGIKCENIYDFTCSISDCSKQFKSKIGLEKHIIIGDHDGEFFFSCSKCPMKFASSLSLKIHCTDLCDISSTEGAFGMMEKDIKEENEFIQEVEVQSEDTIISDDVHQMPYSCDVCQNSLSTKESFDIHMLIHKELNRFTCNEEDCNGVFSNNKSLTVHLKVSHQVVKKNENQMFHMCDDCGKQCTTKAGLQDHMLKHSKDKNFECLECGKRLKRRDTLTTHMKIHAGVKNYQCDQCEANYVSSAALRNHTLSKHTDMTNAVPFICSFCGKDFKKKDYLLKHVTGHTGEKKYPCNVCPKKFRFKTSIENHMNMHNGIKKYQCSHCGKKFTQRQQRTVHVRRHTGDKRHKCNICTLAFIEPRELRNHMKRHHV